jgi:tungstate transport system permease protein
MTEISAAMKTALGLVLGLDANLLEIVGRSLQVSLSALALACAVGLPLGAALALARFPGRGVLVVLLNASMGLPPVVVGLVVYLALSRSGPLGGLGWLFSVRAMVIAQWILITPIVASLTRQTIEDLWEEYRELLTSLGANRRQRISTLLFDGRHRLTTTVLAGFGRAIGEVGAVIVVGGNIAHATRIMTTSIALETSKGDLERALALGIVLLALSISVNALAASIGRRGLEVDG